MQTIQVQVEDNKVDIFLNLVKNLKDGIVKNLTIKTDDIIDKNTAEYMKTKQFKKDKKYFQRCLDDIDSGETKLLSHNEVWEQIDKHTQAS